MSHYKINTPQVTGYLTYVYVIDSIVSNLEETSTRSLVPTQEESHSELDMPITKNTRMSEVAMKQALLLLFDDLCSLQEHSIVGSLMFGLANQMAYRLVFMLQNCVCIKVVVEWCVIVNYTMSQVANVLFVMKQYIKCYALSV